MVTSLPAVSRLFYGPTFAYGSTTDPSLPLTTAYFNLSGLFPYETYHLYATSMANGVVTSSKDIVFIPGASSTATTSLPPFTRNLTIGSIGNDVTELQNLLVQLGYLTATPTGYFGVLTQKAVQSFQIANNVSPASGFVGPLTRAVLNTLLGATPTPTPTSTFTRALIFGDQGSDVTSLQAFLQTQGYLPVAPTGYYGILTEHAVQAFQCDQNIVCSGAPDTTGYGSVGPKTRGAMGL